MSTHPPRDEFASITERSPLVAELRKRIEREGPITFRSFMEAALYHPRHGYYALDPGITSRGGDYVTSPEVHPIFATLIAKQILEFWHALGRPQPFTIVEAGAGRGLLARDILLRLIGEPDIKAALRYRICERYPTLEVAQRNTLSEAGIDLHDVEWNAVLPHVLAGVVLSNELIDAFPVHRVVRSGDALHEVYVGHDGERFHDVLGDVSDPRLEAYFGALRVLPAEGAYAEVNLDAPTWIEGVARSVERGYVLTFDYGYEAADLYAPWRKDGTLLCFYRQSASSDPYQRIGRQDMTSSVDFTTLRAAGERHGLRTVGMTDQASFLVRMGIGEGLAAVARESGANIEEYFARRNVVLDLIDLLKLGRIKVLLQSKNVSSDTRFTGFNDA
jgi:SAM-dependent MidA family methyltransferase